MANLKATMSDEIHGSASTSGCDTVSIVLEAYPYVIVTIDPKKFGCCAECTCRRLEPTYKHGFHAILEASPSFSTCDRHWSAFEQCVEE